MHIHRHTDKTNSPTTLFHKYAKSDFFMKYIKNQLEVRCRDALQSDY